MEANEIFDPDEPSQPQTEWVTLANGKKLCVRELSAADHMRITERTVIRGGPQKGETNRNDNLIWQVMHSCFTGEGPDARPIFTEEKILAIYRLRGRDWGAILDAIARVNAADSERMQATEDFTELRAAE